MVRTSACAADQTADLFDLDLLLQAARTGAVRPVAQGPRARRREARAAIAGSGAIAALLALEGCVPVNSRPEMTAPKRGSGSGGSGAGSPPPAAPPAAPPPAPPPVVEAGGPPIAVAENAASNIPVDTLLKNIPGATSILNIVSVENGTAILRGAVIEFTPRPGFEGPAAITFNYAAQGGQTGTARSALNVNDDALPHQHGGPAGDHGAGHGAGAGAGGNAGGNAGGSGHDHGGAPHPDDPKKAAEHMEVMNLVPVSGATHIAVKSGSWFDPTTWAGGVVPGDGAKVVIPKGISVAYDGQSQASVFTVRVDGALDFATDRDTHLKVDTLVVSPDGALTIGTADNPVAAGVRAVIAIADNGPINVGWDPTLLSRGIISHGDVTIHGAAKESFLKVAIDPMAGATSVTLEAPPEGWRVGDRIVIAGTHLTPTRTTTDDAPRFDDTTEDEVVTITSINGATVHFDRALQFNHEGARPDLKTYVANYTRNVVIQSENGAATPVHQRGHVMFMHSDDIDVRYAEFFELGRTDKSTRAFDVNDLSSVTSTSNLKGRYALHIHRAGVDDPDDPAMIVGNAVWGSPGWGYVHHDSNAILAKNAAFNVFGAAYVAETGNEIGRWADNISIKTIGVHTSVKDPEDIALFDLARSGVGFWFQGRLVDAVNNVAAGAPGGHGFVYMSRTPSDSEIPIDPDVVAQGEKLRYRDGVPGSDPNLGIFRGNEAFAVKSGLEIVKASAAQHNDVRSVLVDFTAWEVQYGATLQYTGHYTLKDFYLVGTDQPWAANARTIGVQYQTNVFDVVFVGGRIDDFVFGVNVWHDTLVSGVRDFQYYFLDVNFISNERNFVDDARAGPGIVAPRFISASDLRSGPLTYESALGQIIDGPDTWVGEPNVILNGFKTDSLGRIATSTSWDPFSINYWNLRGAVEENGIWRLNDGRVVTLIEEYVADRVTGQLEKFALWVEVPSALNLTPGAQSNGVRVAPVDNGLLDLSNQGPIAVNDFATVKSGGKVVIDVLANDRDPEGDPLRLDDFFSERGHVVKTDDGKLAYFADPGFVGTDIFYYWVQDDQGNFTKAQVTVMVDA